jgi:hypothetical protein
MAEGGGTGIESTLGPIPPSNNFNLIVFGRSTS